VYQQVLDPVGSSLLGSALVAAIPLVVLFVLLGALKVRAWLASAISLVVALIVAIAVYGMPVGQALLAGSEGAVFGFFPILWIVINAIWIYSMTVQTGHFDVLRRSFSSISNDQRIQAVIIAFCFGALLEALAGFGTPVAITSVMLIALGFRPLKAATVALVANTAPVAFGAVAVPITTLSTVTGLSVHDLGSTVGRQTPILAIFVPLALVFIVDGRRAVRQVWPAALLCGVVFGVFQFLTSNFISVPLADIVAALASALAVVAFLRVWQPAESYVEPVEERESVAVGAGGHGPATGGAGSGDSGDSGSSGDLPIAADAPPELPMNRAEIFKAYLPYLIVIVVFVLAQIPVILSALDSVTQLFSWPGLHLTSPAGKPLSSVTFKLNWLTAAGTLLLIAGIITALALKVSVSQAIRAYGKTLQQLTAAIATVMLVLGLAYVMNASGQTQTLGAWMAGAGGAFALISPVLGWLGVAVTGSDTSSNSLFGALQITAANQAGLDPTLMAAGNSSGGVLGKMISPQNLAIAASAVGLAGQEGALFRKVLGWSLLFVVFMSVLVYLQSTPVLSWMVT